MGRLSSLWHRLAGRPAAPPAPPPIVDRRRLNEDWKPGDLAVCISNGFVPPCPHDPGKGELLRVTAVREGVSVTVPAYLIIGLLFAGRPQNWCWEVSAFRKVRPDAEAADAEFAAGIRRLAPAEKETV